VQQTADGETNDRFAVGGRPALLIQLEIMSTSLMFVIIAIF
jgi:hypothetical protein